MAAVSLTAESLTRAHARRLTVYGPFIPGPSGHATVTSRVVVGVDPRGRMAGIATWCGDTYLGHELVVRHGRGIIPDSAYLHQVCERIACWLAALPEGQCWWQSRASTSQAGLPAAVVKAPRVGCDITVPWRQPRSRSAASTRDGRPYRIVGGKSNGSPPWRVA